MHDLHTITSYIRRGSCAIDVGANVGLFTYAFSRNSDSVEAFEPLPECAEVLSKFAKIRRNVRVHPIALSDDSGTATIHVPYRDATPLHGWATLREYSGEHTSHNVQLATLDSFGFTNVSVIKIDVEGHEMAVIRGAQETLKREKPVLLIEIEHRHHGQDIRPFLTEIEAMGYTGIFFDEHCHEAPISTFDPNIHQDLARADQGDPRYCINFLFKPTGTT